MSISVQNLAYKKDSWINNKRQFKRHVRNQWTRGQAGRAVDGDVNSPTCTVLDNYFVDKPTWMVDLGKRTKISGVRMITRQGKDPGSYWPKHKRSKRPTQSQAIRHTRESGPPCTRTFEKLATPLGLHLYRSR